VWCVAGCSSIHYKNPTKDIEVNAFYFLVDPEAQTIERVWGESDYLTVAGLKAPVSEKGHEVISAMTRIFIEAVKLYLSGELPAPAAIVAPPD